MIGPLFPCSFTWKLPRRTLRLGARPLVMGILNLTPDSFSDGGNIQSPGQAVEVGSEMEEDGADILDLGAESTRPGAQPLDVETEWARLEPTLHALVGRLQIPISIDTYKPQIALRALEYGVEIVNDVSGGKWETGMTGVLQQKNPGYILTHSQGTPPTMQQNPQYADIIRQLNHFFRTTLAEYSRLGISPETLALDPGIGFGKTAEHNWEILSGLESFLEIGRPIAIGVSRKSFLKKIAGEESIEVSTLAAQVWTATQGAQIWRVHQVRAAVAAARVVEQLQSRKTGTA